MKNLIIKLLLILPYFSFGGSTFEKVIYSPSMDKSIPSIFIIPNQYQQESEDHPAVILLHGYGGSFKNWPSKIDLNQKADFFNMILICPDGSTNSWYLDSPMDSTSQYETFIIKELIPWLRNQYRISTIGITGLSMGGHGALYLAFRNQDSFDAVSSMSGGVDLTYSTVKWEIENKLGPFENFPKRWEENSIVHMVHLLEDSKIPIFIDCGYDDFFIEINRELHHNLLDAKVKHRYVERPGGHSWNYWTKALDDHLEFFQINLTE